MVLARNTEMLRRTQAGLETVRGTPAAPTIRLRDKVRLMDTREPLEFDENAGTYDGWYTFAQGPVTVAGTAEGPASFEDLGYWLLHGVSGDAGLIAGTGDADLVAEAFTRDYIPNPDEDDLASSTMEMDAPDNVYLSKQVMVPEFTLRGDIGGDATWMWSSPLIARSKDPLPAGYTAGVPLHDREFVKGAGTRIYIDDLPADIGETPLAASAISWSLTWSNAASFKRFLEDENELSSKVDRGVRQITGQIRMEFETDDEKAKYRAGTPRAIRIERTGGVIHDAVTKRARIDIPKAYWLTPSDDPRQSNMTLTYGFRAYAETVLGYPARIELVNAIEDYAVELV